MSTYTIVLPQRQAGYRVDVVTDEGSHHTILGFDTEEAAAEWIEADRGLEALRGTSRQGGDGG